MTQLTVRREAGIWGRISRLDLLLVLSTLAIGAFGVIMVYSATKVQLMHAGISGYYYFERQAIYFALGVVVMVVLALIDYQRLAHFAYIIYGASILGLLAVLSPVGTSQLGSQRWFQLGPIQVQPSEFAPIGVIFGISAYVANREDPLDLRAVITILLMGGIPMVLVIKQPDLGTGIVIGIITALLLVMAGVPARYLLALVIIGVVGIVAILHVGFLKSYQLHRLLSFLNPKANASSFGYNLAQSKIAIGSGHIFGVGLFKGSQTTLAFVPSQQTDFIFTAIGEQLGFVGCAGLLLGYAILIWRLWSAMRWSKDITGTLIVAGGLAWIGYSVFQNVGMTIGIMPITGIPLPLISYGGSAMLAFLAMVGLALNIGSQRARVRA
ncbi:rod shape-determining protein RodA [Ferrimicrobium acidiphilum]|jgi:rod shape determining protein RodA|uniref:peptidoglycan glycosyltransferase n=1 Tax=Ferrimicrobium acidiphilum DSM 19497 TaxID=1121877 RepID=A0A0D8FYX0_9ACTN|nr:rod shape-determining protein RodA [Ferrimicrobium acidiphilum]KJE78007.1 Rod shape-determining protein RodA [Ferrimicrobium acidiphilum DSM 19497]MCL5054137.1 rod shape-determining protein RodA [Gammaproteobacteria bacterium]